MYDIELSKDLQTVSREAGRWAASAQLSHVTDVELILAAVDFRAELLETIGQILPVDRHRFVEQLSKRRPPGGFSTSNLPRIDRRTLRVLDRARSFGGGVELPKAIHAVIREPSEGLRELLDYVSSGRTPVPADWLDSPSFWFSPATSLPGPSGQRIENGPFGNDRMASSRDLQPYLNDPHDDQHLPFSGVTIVVDDPQDDSQKG